MDKKLIYTSDLWVDLKDYQRSVFWHEIYKSQTPEGSKNPFKYEVFICRRYHENPDELNVHSQMYWSGYMNHNRKLSKKNLNQALYSEEGAKRFSHSKLRALTNKKGKTSMIKLVDHETFRKKLNESFEFLNKYLEE